MEKKTEKMLEMQKILSKEKLNNLLRDLFLITYKPLNQTYVYHTVFCSFQLNPRFEGIIVRAFP